MAATLERGFFSNWRKANLRPFMDLRFAGGGTGDKGCWLEQVARPRWGAFGPSAGFRSLPQLSAGFRNFP